MIIKILHSRAIRPGLIPKMGQEEVGVFENKNEDNDQ
jgi:hypothetical protein